jgi:general secretion pathway protein G
MRKASGFTLVEILIVVVILGILAAIVIPQFTNASEAAKGSSLQSQLQTIRSQLELYQVQHNGNYPVTGTDGAAGQPPEWDVMTQKTDVDGTVLADQTQEGNGPYLQQCPTNPFVDSNAFADHFTYDPTNGSITAVGFDEVSGEFTAPAAAP